MAAHLTNEHPTCKQGIELPKINKWAKKEKKVPLTEAEKHTIDKALENFIIGTLSAIRIVDKEPLKKLCTALNDRYEVPCVKTVTNIES